MAEADAALSDTGGSRGSWRQAIAGNVLMLGLVSLFTDLSSEMMSPLLPVFIAGLVPAGMAPVFVGLMEGLAETTASLLKLISGRLSDRLGKRKALVALGYGLSAAARPMMALAGLAGAAFGGWQAVGLKFLDRVGKGLRTAPRDALIGDSVGAGVRGLAFSFHRAMDHVGSVAGSLASAAILLAFLGRGLWQGTTDRPSDQEMTAMRWLFAVALVPGLIAVATLVLKVREIAPGPAASRLERPGATVRRGLPGRFFLYVAVVTLFTLGNSSDMFLLLYARQKFGLGLAYLIGLWVALHVSKVIFSLPGGILADRLGRRPAIVLGWLIYALVYLGLSQAAQQWQFWALFVFYGVYYGMCEGAERALVADFAPSERRGTAFGVYNAAVGVAALPSSALFGVYWAAIGPGWAFGIGAALAGLACVLLVALLATAKPPAARSGEPHLRAAR